MKNTVFSIICITFILTLSITLLNCGGGGPGVEKPGDEMKTYTQSLGGGVQLSVKSPVNVTFNTNPLSGTYPEGWSKVDEVLVNGALGAGQAAEVIYESGSPFDDAVDRVACVDADGNWIPFDSTARAIGNTLSAFTTQLDMVFGLGAFFTLSGTLTYSGSLPVDATHPIYLSAYNLDLDSTYIADPITSVPFHYSFLLPQGDYVLFAVRDENNNQRPDNTEVYQFYDNKGDPLLSDIIDLTGDRNIMIDLSDTFSLNNTVMITYPDNDTVSGDFTASGSFTGIVDRIEVSVDGTLLGEANLDEIAYTWSFDITVAGLIDGTHTIEADAYMDDYSMDSDTKQFAISTGGGPATVQGTLTLPFAAPGAFWYALVLEYNGGWNTIEDTYGWCGSDIDVQYSITDVPQGTYYIYASVDVDDSGGAPSLGDYLGYYGGSGPIPPASANAEVPASGVVTFDFPLTTYQVGVVQGTLTLPSASPGTNFELYIDTDTVPDNDNYAIILQGQCGFDPFLDYSLTDVPVWTYYVYAWVDRDQSTSLSIGDYFGFYGGSGTSPPAAPNVTIPASDTVTCDFSLAPYQITGWSIEILDSMTDVGLDTSLVLDSNNYPHIAYQDSSNSSLKYARWNGSVWSFETVDSASLVGSDTQLALDSNGYPHICYYDWSGFMTPQLKYAQWNGSMWSVQTVDTIYGLVTYTALALDSNNYPHIAYYDGTNDDLLYARWTGSTWSIETVDSTGDVGRFISLTIDSNDHPHISYHYYAYAYDLKYAYWDGSTWSIETVESLGSVGLYTSIELDSSDYPHISYNDNDTLRYAKWTGSTWSFETVDSTGEVGFFTSLELDSNEYPHISYFDYDGILKYAKWNGSTWSIETIESPGELGRPSLVLDSSDNPHISYVDASNDKLKYVRFIP